MGEEDLRGLTATEVEEAIRDFVVRGARDPLVNNDVMCSPSEVDIDAEVLDSEGDQKARLLKAFAPARC